MSLTAQMSVYCCAAATIGGYSDYYGGSPSVAQCKADINEALESKKRKVNVWNTVVYVSGNDCKKVDGWELVNNWVRAYLELGWTMGKPSKGSYGNYLLVPFTFVRNPLDEDPSNNFFDILKGEGYAVEDSA